MKDLTPNRFAGFNIPAVPLGPARVPDFLVIGASKSGTTTLWRYLQRHPRIHMLEPKEPEFFAKQEVYSRGLDWYKQLFTAAPADKICGEASTTYSRWPHFGDVPARIHDAAPNVRLLYMLRNPVDRTYSQYKHRMRLNVPRMTFEEALDHDAMFIDTSMYMMQIEQFLKRFPRESLECVLLDDLKNSPAETLSRVQRFLGLDETDLTADSQVIANTAEASAGSDYARQRLGAALRRVPAVHAATRLLPPRMRETLRETYVRSPLGRRKAQEYQPSPFLPETRAMLVEKFQEPNRKLGEFLGRDLSMWNR